jgi:PKD repeat protein
LTKDADLMEHRKRPAVWQFALALLPVCFILLFILLPQSAIAAENYSITVDKAEYYMNESVYITAFAAYNTSLSLAIVHCGLRQNYSTTMYNSTLMLYVPNSTGIYSVEAVMRHSNNSISVNSSFNVVEKLACVIGTNSGTTNVSETFSAEVTGGKAPYTFLWNFGDSSRSSSESPQHDYEKEGKYGLSLRVTDSGGKEALCKNEVAVKDKVYTLSLILLDNSTMGGIGDATLTSGSLKTKSNVHGKAYFSGLKSGNYTVRITHSLYDSEKIEINLSSDTEIKVLMDPTPEENRSLPRITLIDPQENFAVHERSFNFEYEVRSSSKVSYCKLLFNEESLLGMRVKGTLENVTRDTIHTFEANMTNGDFKWRVRCANEAGASTTEERHIIVSGLAEPEPAPVKTSKSDSDALSAKAAQAEPQNSAGMGGIRDLSSELKEIDQTLAEIDTAINAADRYGSAEKAVAEQLGILDKLKESRKALGIIRSNVDSLQGLNIPEIDFRPKKSEYMSDYENIKSTTINGFSVIEKDEYVQEMQEDALSDISARYLGAKNKNLSKSGIRKYTARSASLQESMKVETLAENVAVEYLSGQKSSFTIIDKRISIGNVSGAVFVESVPKAFAEDMDNIDINRQYEVIQQDPLFGIEINDLRENNRLIYMVQKRVSLEEVKDARSALLVRSDEAMPTGFAILGQDLGDAKTLLLLCVLAGLLIGGYYLARTDNIRGNSIKEALYSIKPSSKSKKLHDLLCSSLDLISKEKHEEAFLLYDRIISLYEKAPQDTKHKTKEAMIFLSHELELFCLNKMIEEAHTKLTSENVESVRHLHSEIENRSRCLGERQKNSIRGRLTKLNVAVRIKQMKAESGNSGPAGMDIGQNRYGKGNVGRNEESINDLIFGSK